jgi:RHS repeat-associated protein
MTYGYDTLHGWLTGVSSSCGFSEQLLRETATDALLNGNIGSMLWRNTSNGEQHRYDYTYDTLGRLTNSQYSSSANGTSGRFDETVTYNSNGSVASLQRNGMKNNGTFGAIDNLTISYNGNQLVKVTDAAEALNYNGALDFHDGDDTACEYDYDSNGALTRDSNRGINGITYDYGHHPNYINMNMTFGSEMRISNPAQMSGDTSHPFRFTGKELDRQNSLNMYDFGARMFDVAGVPMWTSIDPLAEKYYGISPYAYCANNPVMLVDPDGNSPLSALIKVTAKQGVKAGIKTYVKNNIEYRLKNYMSDKMLKQFAKDVDDVMGTLDNSWWETALELVPVAGDIYGSTKFVKQVKKAYDKLQDLENKYVGKIYDALPKTERKKFVQNMRRKGVADARIDQAKGLDVGGDVKYEKGKGIDGHHSDKVSENPDKMTDPRNIKFMKQEDHIKYHQQNGY